MWLTRFAIRQPTIVTLFFFAISLFGLVGYFSMGRNILPNVQFPAVSVTAVYPGASPQEIERLILRPIEDEIQNVAHVDRVRSNAQDGTGWVGVRFKLGTDINAATTDVQHAVDAARSNLPSDLDPPQLSREDPSYQPIMIESVTSSSMSPVALSDLVTNEIVPQLRATKGVGTVFAGGKFQREISVEPDLSRLQSIGGTVLDVNSAVGQGNVSLPGGRLDQPFQESTVGVRADITSAEQIAALPLVVPGGATQQLQVGNVARVVDAYQDHRIVSIVNNRPAVVLNVSRDSDADTLKATKAVRDEFKTLQAKYPAAHFEELEADADFMHDAINGVLQNLLEGIALTALVLLLFLHVWRSALVVMVAIPTSLMATFFIMWARGLTVDLLSLMGLSLTIGILVDDSIVVIENITRHRELGKPAEEAAITGRSEIGGAAVAITLVDVVVFAPIAFMSGIVGEYLREFGLVVVVATLFSLFVSFTLTPLLAARWSVLRKPRPIVWLGLRKTFELVRMRAHGRNVLVDSWLGWTVATALAAIVGSFAKGFEAVRKGYHDRWLPWGLRHPWVVLIGSFVMVGASFVGPVSGGVPFEFQPYTEYGLAVVSMTYRPGTPIAETQNGTERLSSAILKLPGVKAVSANIGEQSNGFTDQLGGYVSQMYVVLDPSRRHEEHKILDRIPSLSPVAPGARVSAAGGQSGGQAPIVYTLSGPADALDAAGAKLAAALKKNPLSQDVQTSSAIVGPRLDINIDRQRSALLGVSPQAAALTARAAMGGVIATKVRMPEGLVNAIVRLPADTRDDVSNVEQVDVRSANGMLIPLTDVARFTRTTEPPLIERANRQRIVRVTADTRNNAPIGMVSTSADKALAQPGFLPAGVSVESEGDTQLLQDSMRKIGLGLVTSFLLIYMLLVVLYRSYLTPFVIMFSVPVALVGVFGILWFANAMHGLLPEVRWFQGQTLNIFSMLGIVMLIGLVAKNGILLVDYANTLLGRGLQLPEAIRESASVRFRPIIMTTASMIFGMLPLAMGITEGAEFRKSIGTVIIGGLTSSLLMTLFLVPVVYVWLVGAAQRAALRRAKRLALSPVEAEGGLAEG